MASNAIGAENLLGDLKYNTGIILWCKESTLDVMVLDYSHLGSEDFGAFERTPVVILAGTCRGQIQLLEDSTEVVVMQGIKMDWQE